MVESATGVASRAIASPTAPAQAVWTAASSVAGSAPSSAVESAAPIGRGARWRLMPPSVPAPMPPPPVTGGLCTVMPSSLQPPGATG